MWRISAGFRSLRSSSSCAFTASAGVPYPGPSWARCSQQRWRLRPRASQSSSAGPSLSLSPSTLATSSALSARTPHSGSSPSAVLSASSSRWWYCPRPRARPSGRSRTSWTASSPWITRTTTSWERTRPSTDAVFKCVSACECVRARVLCEPVCYCSLLDAQVPFSITGISAWWCIRMSELGIDGYVIFMTRMSMSTCLCDAIIEYLFSEIINYTFNFCKDR